MAKSHAKLDMSLDVESLKNSLNTYAEEFGKYPYRGDFEGSPHAQMKDIWVRYNDVAPYEELGDFSGFADEHDSTWYEIADRIPVKDLVFEVMSKVDGERLGGVLITRLPPGGKILPHTDAGWHAAYYDKYYVPVQNAKGSTFSFTDGTIAPDEGDVWWFNNAIEHWVDNNTKEDRIAMIICIKTDNRLGE